MQGGGNQYLGSILRLQSCARIDTVNKTRGGAQQKNKTRGVRNKRAKGLANIRI